MKYEIAYLSGAGNTEKLAHGIADSLPHRDTFVTDLSCEEITGKADVCLIGFGMKKEAVPLKIMDVLEKLEGKIILFFVTASVKPTEEHVKDIERKLNPFMPSECDYRGLYLCPGQVSAETVAKIKMLFEREPQNEQAKKAYDVCVHAVGRPNQNDIDNAVGFVFQKLNLPR